MISTSPAEIDRWLAALRNLERNDRAAAPGFLTPVHMATLSLSIKMQGKLGLQLPARLTEYAARMGVWSAAGLSDPVQVRHKDPGNRFCELIQLEDRARVDDAADRITNIVASNQRVPCDRESEDSLRVAVSELVDNCHAHSRTAQGFHGLVCAQTWYRGDSAQFAVVDCGIGIRQSLEESTDPQIAERLSTTNASVLACEYGVSSKLGRGHSGYGLTLASDLARSTADCMFYLHSHGECYAVQDGRDRDWTVPLQDAFMGTVVAFQWSLKSMLDVASVYRSWPNSEVDSDDDWDF